MNTQYESPVAPAAVPCLVHAERSGWSAAILALLVLSGCGGGSDGGSPAIDTTAPSVPQAVTAVAESATQVRITWSASIDTGQGVAGYRVYRDGVAAPIATVTSGTTHTDTGLLPSTRYSYSVTAFDRSSPTNESARIDRRRGDDAERHEPAQAGDGACVHEPAGVPVPRAGAAGAGRRLDVVRR
ncbi:MAG: fibronectin type III domain-containing protein [Proteobacteria bacterium]|nr:fibronectin type III domain-containing protein [Pseudomonadota bacterium]